MFAAGAAGLMLLALAPDARAQSTDGYHSIQVIPVVVDSASFAQRFNFTTPNQFPVTVQVKFFPGDGTAQAATGPVTCNDVAIPANGAIVVSSLRTLCPGLVSGTAFGFLHLQSAPSSDGMFSDIPVFAAFSRVANPQGNGFSVEAFPAHTFTSASSVVTGLRRLASTSNSPAYQTNCFMANMNWLDPETTPVAKTVKYTVVYGGNEWNATVNLMPGQFVRLLDIFATVGTDQAFPFLSGRQQLSRGFRSAFGGSCGLSSASSAPHKERGGGREPSRSGSPEPQSEPDNNY